MGGASWTKRYANPIRIKPDGNRKKDCRPNSEPVLLCDNPKGVYYTADNADGKLVGVYMRLLIRRLA